MADDITPPSGGRTASDFRDIADTLRTRVDLFGKTLAAVASVGITAVGLEKFSSLVPGEGNRYWVALACVGLFVAALAAVAVAVRLMWVAGPVFIHARILENTEELGDSHDRADVEHVFRDAAARFGYRSLVGLQERERSLRNAAARANDTDERARRTALADAVKAEIEQALARSQVVVVRNRAKRAVGGWVSWLCYAAIAIGLGGFAVTSNLALKNSAAGAVSEAEACAAARKADATPSQLKKASCDPKKPEAESAPPSAAVARAQVTKQLAAALEACAVLVRNEGDAKSGPLDDEDCDPVREALKRQR